MEDAKVIISKFLKVQPSEISNDTKIDSSATGGSIILLRMYSKLASSGYTVKNPMGISTFGEFCGAITALNNNSKNDPNANVDRLKNNHKDAAVDEIGIGIDIEDISNFPSVENFFEEQFYIDNFSSYEIEYCAARKNPLESFAALFSLKEAIVKADNSFGLKKFNQINIKHNPQGKPEFKNFYLSTSHSKDLVMSLAITGQETNEAPIFIKEKSESIENEKKLGDPYQNNYFTRAQTLFILFLVSAPIYIISILQYS